jgi:hypothetical protein
MRNGSDHYARITPGSDGGIFLNCTGIQPGSVFYIDSAVAPSIAYIYIYHIKGAPGCYIKLENYGDATMATGIDMDQHSDWGEISGSGPLGVPTEEARVRTFFAAFISKGILKKFSMAPFKPMTRQTDPLFIFTALYKYLCPQRRSL